MTRLHLVGRIALGSVLCGVLALACWVSEPEGDAPALTLEDAQALVAATDRSEEDRERDARRQPAAFLAFAQVQPGDRVADLGAGSGYTTELLVRAVGPDGTVYGQNSPSVIERFVGESWPARLAKPVNQGVVRLDRDFAEVLPAEVADLDLITMVYVYHDLPLYGVDRGGFAQSLYDALKPGGVVVLVDHHAAAGAPVDETANTLHRIDEAVVRADLEGAGFVLDASADFLRNPDDPREQPFFQMDGPTDAFVHRWKKPSADG